MIVVSGGKNYTDIDVLACGVAYAEFLNLTGKPAICACIAELTESVTESVLAWHPVYQGQLAPEELAKYEAYILVDFNNPGFVPGYVDINKVIKVIDHHFLGFEQGWFDKLGKEAVIELVGSCSSLVWREFRDNDLLDKMSLTSARLLYTAIISNSLDLQAAVTTPLDIEAAQDLLKRTNLPDDFKANYYAEIEQKVLRNPVAAILKDTNLYEIKGIQVPIGQLEMWHSKEFLVKDRPGLLKLLREYKLDFAFITCPSIADHCNYILPLNDTSLKRLESVVKLTPVDGVYQTEKLFLRKELIKKLLA